MSDSRRTDTRKIFFTFLAVLFSLSTLSTTSYADPELPPDSIGLFDGLEGIDLSKLLGSVMQNEILVMASVDKNALRSALFDLVQYMRNNTDSRNPDDVMSAIPKYRRLEMFGTWVNEDGPENCYNTRTEVLLRDLSGTKVSFSKVNPCNVSRGLWHDLYSGNDFKTASAVQVDHVIPLKNAYRSGAHAWSRERRCHFANYLEDNRHLLAVSGQENMSKGDSGPESYLPSNETYVCEYIANWLRIKASWNLQFSSAEAFSIERELKDRGCKVAGTRLPLSEIQKNRAASLRMNNKCSLPQ